MTPDRARGCAGSPVRRARRSWSSGSAATIALEHRRGARPTRRSFSRAPADRSRRWGSSCSRRPDDAARWLMVGDGARGGHLGPLQGYGALRGRARSAARAARRSRIGGPGWVPFIGDARASCCCSSPTGICRRRVGGGSPGCAGSRSRSSSSRSGSTPVTSPTRAIPEIENPIGVEALEPSSTSSCPAARGAARRGRVASSRCRAHAPDHRRRPAPPDPLARVRRVAHGDVSSRCPSSPGSATTTSLELAGSRTSAR